MDFQIFGGEILQQGMGDRFLGLQRGEALDLSGGTFCQRGNFLTVGRYLGGENAALTRDCRADRDTDQAESDTEENEDNHHRPCPWNLPFAEQSHDGSEQISKHSGNRHRGENRLQISADRDDAPSCQNADRDDGQGGERSQCQPADFFLKGGGRIVVSHALLLELLSFGGLVHQSNRPSDGFHSATTRSIRTSCSSAGTEGRSCQGQARPTLVALNSGCPSRRS